MTGSAPLGLQVPGMGGGETLCKQESYWVWEIKRFTGNFYKEREISGTVALDNQATFDR